MTTQYSATYVVLRKQGMWRCPGCSVAWNVTRSGKYAKSSVGTTLRLNHKYFYCCLNRFQFEG